MYSPLARMGVVSPISNPPILGPELVSNGTFDTDLTGITASNSTITRDTSVFPNGGLKIEAAAGSFQGATVQTISCTIGEQFLVTARAYAEGANTATNAASLTFLSSGGGVNDGDQVSAEDEEQGLRFTFTATATSHTLYAWVLNRGVAWASAGDIAYFDNISIRKVL